eukprot:9264083-Pyramimonas_sp.AAC.1
MEAPRRAAIPSPGKGCDRIWPTSCCASCARAPPLTRDVDGSDTASRRRGAAPTVSETRWANQTRP